MTLDFKGGEMMNEWMKAQRLNPSSVGNFIFQYFLE
jgi:hypothetical protein